MIIDSNLRLKINALAQSIPKSIIMEKDFEIIILVGKIKLTFIKQEQHDDFLSCGFSVEKIEFHTIDVLQAAANIWPDLSLQVDFEIKNIPEKKRNQYLVDWICNGMSLAGQKIISHWQDWFQEAVRLTVNRVAHHFPWIAASFEKEAMDFYQNSLNQA